VTYEEAVTICSIASTADGGCSYCVTSLMKQVSEAWPGIDWRKAFAEGASEYGGEWIPDGENL
jgi:hypothetical protein